MQILNYKSLIFLVFINSLFLMGSKSENIHEYENTDSAYGEWITLFDGESTEHWRGYNMDDMPETWVIEGDELVLHPGQRPRAHIITKEKYQNFEFRAEYNISEGGNSGIFHHVIEQPGMAIHWSGPELQILDNDAFPDFLDNQLSASLYDLIPASPQNTRPAGEWNEIIIISDGPLVEYWQNGEKVIEFERWSVEWFEMVRNTKFECHTSFGTVPEGHIGLQDHGDLVKFRNIRIRKLN